MLGSQRALNLPGPTSQLFMQAFGAPDAEKIQPTWLNTTVAYSGSGVVFGVIAARMNLFTEAEFKFQRLADKSIYGSQALRLLEEPWPGGTSGELLARMEQDTSLAGNAFIRRVSPTRLERLRPDWVTIVSTVTDEPYGGTQVREVVGYLYAPPATEDREPDFYSVSEVTHWSPVPDPLASFRGMSWLTPVLREADADMQMTDYKRAYLGNAATPNMLIRYADKVGTTRLEILRERLHARHGGVDNAFKTLILDEGADVTLLGHNMEQMTFTAVQAAGEGRIASAGGVPPVVAGLKEGLDAANYAMFEAALKSFANGTMRPHWRSACAALAKLVDVPEDSRLWFDEAGIAALRQGEKEQADTSLVWSQAAETLIRAGFTPQSVTLALTANDMTLLVHTGLVSVQMQTPGTTPGPKEGTP